jgi:hypothetical protein
LINLVVDLDFEELEDGGGEMGEKSYVEKVKVMVETLNVGAKRWAKNFLMLIGVQTHFTKV